MEGPARSSPSAGLLHRLGPWSPVLLCTIVFAQIAFLGLRPALCEQRRLAEAERMMVERHERDLALRDAIGRSLRARRDPIFLERQRRMRRLGPLVAQR